MTFSYFFFQDLLKFWNSPSPGFMHFIGRLHTGGVIKAHSFRLEAGNWQTLFASPHAIGLAEALSGKNHSLTKNSIATQSPHPLG